MRLEINGEKGDGACCVCVCVLKFTATLLKLWVRCKVQNTVETVKNIGADSWSSMVTFVRNIHAENCQSCFTVTEFNIEFQKFQSVIYKI